MADRFQIRRDDAAAWALANPVLSDGEIAWERDTNLVKIGDGVTPWLTLPYLEFSRAEPSSPAFTYVAGRLTGIVYSNGATKTFTYNGDGTLAQIEFAHLTRLVRKTFFYVGGVLDHITEVVL